MDYELQELMMWLVGEMDQRSGEFFYSTRSGYWYASLPVTNQDEDGIQEYVLAQSTNLKTCLRCLRSKVEARVEVVC